MDEENMRGGESTHGDKDIAIMYTNYSATKHQAPVVGIISNHTTPVDVKATTLHDQTYYLRISGFSYIY